MRYSPILPAFLTPGEGPPRVPKRIQSLGFLFATAPYKALGTIKPHLQPDELPHVYFTQGLASILLLNCTLDRAREFLGYVGAYPFEYWPVERGKLDVGSVIVEMPRPNIEAETQIELPKSNHPDLTVYVEQISASIASLWHAYRTYFPEERDTLRAVARLATSLIQHHNGLKREMGKSEHALVAQKKANAIVSVLVELSAALSYAVTQGTSGSLPILSNRSPFPHHSLVGIGGAVRAIAKFTRYLESAFMVRSAAKVILGQYSIIKHDVPASIAKYDSGPQYRLANSPEVSEEEFDRGGDFRQEDQIPLIAHFSLRHGFMESKVSVTAASESLTAEVLPQWTLMTLSHEVMHSRVRMIFQALFGSTWEDDEYTLVRPEHYREMTAWIESRGHPHEASADSALRSVVLNFCYAMDQAANPTNSADDCPGQRVPLEKVRECYAKHKQLAIEIFVHFHDYFFAYACQPKMYIMSLWASWVKVAAPFSRTLEYLGRSLATVASGTGLEPRAAFDFAAETLLEGLEALEAANVRSPLFDRLRELTISAEEVENTRAFFKPLYYLIDQVRFFFASRRIASRIDRIEDDPFAEGSTCADDYSANVYVYGEGGDEFVSPIRYSLAALFKSLSGQLPIDDPQWLTAWNFMVISSQDIQQC